MSEYTTIQIKQESKAKLEHIRASMVEKLKRQVTMYEVIESILSERVREERVRNGP